MAQRFLLLFALLNIRLCSAAPIPNSPAGQMLRAWFEAFNSGDRARVESFLHQYQGHDSADHMLALHSATGSLLFLSVEKVDRSRIVFKVLQRATSKTAMGVMDCGNTAAPKIRRLNFKGLDQLLPNSESLHSAFH